MDVINLWKYTGVDETDDINIIKTWLLNGSDGQTYPINDRFLMRIDYDDDRFGPFDFGCIESEWDDIIGFKHDFTFDDPKLDSSAKEIRDGLMEFIRKINENPNKYFKEKHESISFGESADCTNYWVATFLDLSNDDNPVFGNIGGFIYKTKEEAWNAMKNDATEHSNGYYGTLRYTENKKHFRIDAVGSDGSLIARWEIQCMKFSSEANGFD